MFLKIRCPLERLKQHADDINFKLKLDPIKLRIHAQQGKREKDSWVWLPIDIPDTEGQSTYDPYDCIYGQFDSRQEIDDVYKRYGGKKKIFRGVDRIKLIRSILEVKKT